MRPKRFTYGITFFVTAEMYREIKSITDAMEMGIAEFMRGLVTDAFERAEYKIDTPLDEAEEDAGEEKENGTITRKGSI
jgi:hypothetical protein